MQIIVNGPNIEGERKSFEQGKVLIGRLEECDLVLPHPTVSKKHAEIVSDRGGYLIRDLGSFNGTYVNGQWVKKVRSLEVGDRIKMGPYELIFMGTEQADRIKVSIPGRKKKRVKNGETPESKAQTKKSARPTGVALKRSSQGETTQPMAVDLKAGVRRRRARKRAHGRKSLGDLVRSKAFLYYLAAAAVGAFILVLAYLLLAK